MDSILYNNLKEFCAKYDINCGECPFGYTNTCSLLFTIANSEKLNLKLAEDLIAKEGN